MPTVLWNKSTLIGMLVARAELRRLPAQTWPLEGAIETLAGVAAPGSRLQRAALSWLVPRPTPAGRVTGMAAWTREAVESELLEPEGSGWAAGYRVNRPWLDQAKRMTAVLGAADLAALDRAAQGLVAMATMLSKKAAA